MVLSVLTGLLSAYFGDGITFSNEKSEPEPKTAMGKRLHPVERLTSPFAIFLVLFAIGTGFVDPTP